MLGWTLDEMVGGSISMLMNPKLSESHDQSLARYVAQLEVNGTIPASTVVGQGRDVAVLCANGEYVRMWISVQIVQTSSKRPQDCLFACSLLYMQSASHSEHHRESSTIHGNPAGPPRRSSAFSDKPTSAGGHVVSAGGSISPRSGMRVTGLARRKCTMMLFDVFGMQTAGGEQLSVEYQTFLSLMVSACSKNGLQIHDPLGDRILVTSNLLASSGSQRSVVGMVMQQVLQSFHLLKSFGTVQVYGAACCTEAHIGNFGKQMVIAGEGYDLCGCMLHLAEEARARNGFIDPSLHGELQFTYECRVANVVTLHPSEKRSLTLPIYELFALKEMSEDEWMYQIEGEKRADPLVAWDECWAHLLRATGALPGQYPRADVLQRNGAALGCLDRHLQDNEEDVLALWLQRVLQQADGSPTAVQRAGKLLYLPHFTLSLPDR
eukprot:GGOE01009176.1.p1 GENE.GGOE01009176.1~~GGOE01009176.1.p1  ORF type:complete len:436 (+),score=111.40 GGOE01009176.1:1101-2408(+)